MVIDKDKLTQGLPDNYYIASTDTFRIKSISQAKGDSAKICFYFSRFILTQFFNTGKESDDFSMRYLLPYDKDKMTKGALTAGRIAIFAYSLPHQGMNSTRSSYCDLTAAGVPPSAWWEKYHVKHFIVFYLQIN